MQLRRQNAKSGRNIKKCTHLSSPARWVKGSYFVGWQMLRFLILNLLYLIIKMSPGKERCDFWLISGRFSQYFTGLWVVWLVCGWCGWFGWFAVVWSFTANDFKNPLKIDFAEKMVIYFIIALTTMLWIWLLDLLWLYFFLSFAGGFLLFHNSIVSTCLEFVSSNFFL